MRLAFLDFDLVLHGKITNFEQHALALHHW
ncbi:MAG: hypothetical protein JWN70_214, partial [Planctomycetaceae bacterium]|nr:hypothetical protein [Planctomycetaceae bacterium]